MRRLAWKVDFNIVNIAPTPPLRRVVALDDGVARGFEVFSSVTMGGLIAASDVPAIATQAQMHPTRSNPEAFLATKCTGGDDLDLMRV